MSIATASDLETAPARPLLTPLLSATACVALADWLFYDWQIGISLALFLGVLGAVAVAGNRVYATRTVQIVMAAIFAASLLALIEDVNVLSVIVGTLATALFVIVMTARENSSWQWNLFEAAIAPLRGPFQLAGDLFVTLQQMKQQVPEWLGMGSLIAWIVPLCVFAVFLGLFSSANPLECYSGCSSLARSGPSSTAASAARRLGNPDLPPLSPQSRLSSIICSARRRCCAR